MKYKVHQFQSSEMGLSVNAYVVESQNGVVVVDATLLQSDSKALAKQISDIGKPILAILITHGHPDHIAGLTNLTGKDQPPIIALQSIVDLMKSTEADKHAQWAGMFGEEWINTWTYPDQIVSDGDRLIFDGLTFSVHDIGAGGDCDANSIWMLESDVSQAFVGDIIYTDNFTYMNDGQILRWLANLDRFTPLLKDAENLYNGHGRPGGIQLIDQQKQYLNEYCATLLSITKGNNQLDEEMTDRFVKAMERKFPAYGLNFMIGLSAAKVASEL